MSTFLDLLKLKDYIPQILEVVANGQVLINAEAELQDRATALVNLLDLAADFTETEWDDELVERLADVIECEEFWQAVDVIVECIMDDHDHSPMQLTSAMEAKSISPSTIVLIVEVILQIIKLFKGK